MKAPKEECQQFHDDDEEKRQKSASGEKKLHRKSFLHAFSISHNGSFVSYMLRDETHALSERRNNM
jgi:hypothetical protein